MCPHARKVVCTKARVQRDGAELGNAWGGDGHGLHDSQPDLDAHGYPSTNNSRTRCILRAQALVTRAKCERMQPVWIRPKPFPLAPT